MQSMHRVLIFKENVIVRSRFECIIILRGEHVIRRFDRCFFQWKTTDDVYLKLVPMVLDSLVNWSFSTRSRHLHDDIRSRRVEHESNETEEKSSEPNLLSSWRPRREKPVPPGLIARLKKKRTCTERCSWNEKARNRSVLYVIEKIAGERSHVRVRFKSNLYFLKLQNHS